jgi:hypothetical protein
MTPATLDSLNYTYNPVGSITHLSDVRNGTSTEDQCFDYDPLGRLATAWR